MVIALLAFAGTAQAGGSGGATVYISGSTYLDRSYVVVPDPGFACNLTSGSGDPLGLTCYDQSIGIAHCGTVTASVTNLSGTGGVHAEATCGLNQATCNAVVVLTTVVNQPCAVSVSGDSVPSCNFVTDPGLNFNYTARCA